MPNAELANVLLHEISHNYKISDIEFLQGVNIPYPLLKIQGQLKSFGIVLKDKA